MATQKRFKGSLGVAITEVYCLEGCNKFYFNLISLFHYSLLMFVAAVFHVNSRQLSLISIFGWYSSFGLVVFSSFITWICHGLILWWYYFERVGLCFRIVRVKEGIKVLLIEIYISTHFNSWPKSLSKYFWDVGAVAILAINIS